MRARSPLLLLLAAVLVAALTAASLPAVATGPGLGRPTATVNSAGGPEDPAFSVTPGGPPVVDVTLRADAPDGYVATWRIGGEVVATGPEFTPTSDHVGGLLIVTFAVDGGEASHSMPLGEVLAEAPAFRLQTSGTATVGTPATVQPEGPLTESYTYVWTLDGEQVEGADAAAFTPNEEMVGEVLRVVVTRVSDLAAVPHNFGPVTEADPEPGEATVSVRSVATGLEWTGAPRVGEALEVVVAATPEPEATMVAWLLTAPGGSQEVVSEEEAFTPAAEHVDSELSVQVTLILAGQPPRFHTVDLGAVAPAPALAEFGDVDLEVTVAHEGNPRHPLIGDPLTWKTLTAAVVTDITPDSISYEWSTGRGADRKVLSTRESFTPTETHARQTLSLRATLHKSGFREEVVDLVVGEILLTERDNPHYPFSTFRVLVSSGGPAYLAIRTITVTTVPAADRIEYAWLGSDGRVISTSPTYAGAKDPRLGIGPTRVLVTAYLDGYEPVEHSVPLGDPGTLIVEMSVRQCTTASCRLQISAGRTIGARLSIPKSDEATYVTIKGGGHDPSVQHQLPGVLTVPLTATSLKPFTVRVTLRLSNGETAMQGMTITPRRPATILRWSAAPKKAVARTRQNVAFSGLERGEQWALKVAGKVVAEGTAAGLLTRAEFKVPKTKKQKKVRVVVVGSQNDRSGSFTMTITPAKKKRERR